MKNPKRAKTREAVAVEYDPLEDRAPRVVAKGKGNIAERIIETARKAGVPVREDRELVYLLSHLDVDQEIPPEVYQVVAEILAFAYRVHNRWKAGVRHASPSGNRPNQ